MFVSNHPYEGGLPHVSDMAFVAPVVRRAEIVAFAGSIAHKADVGGSGAGLDLGQRDRDVSRGPAAAADQDLVARRLHRRIERIILTNSRQPELMRGDIHAQIAVTQMGAARVKELCERFGAATVTDAFAAILKGAADELRARDRRRCRTAKPRPKASRQRRRRGRQADQARGHGHDQGRHRDLRFLRQRPQARRRSICGRRWSRPACSIR